jgi:hypothetical protein
LVLRKTENQIGFSITAGSFKIKALQFTIFPTQKAREIVTKAGKPSGMAATTGATEAKKFSIAKEIFKQIGCQIPSQNPHTKSNYTYSYSYKAKPFTKSFSFSCKGDNFSSASWIHVRNRTNLDWGLVYMPDKQEELIYSFQNEFRNF